MDMEPAPLARRPYNPLVLEIQAQELQEVKQEIGIVAAPIYINRALVTDPVNYPYIGPPGHSPDLLFCLFSTGVHFPGRQIGRFTGRFHRYDIEASAMNG